MTLCVLGIDPGSVRTGYGIILFGSGQPKLIASGCITTRSSTPFPQRLHTIYKGLCAAIASAEVPPNEAAIESVFVGRNAPTALKLGQARGVAILAAVEAGLPVHEYRPTEVKKAVAGSGRADKEQVRALVGAQLRHRFTGHDDETDALAVALCHGFGAPMRARMSQLKAPAGRRR